MVVHPLKHIPEMFETAEWDDDDDGPQLSALGQAAARREDEKSKDTGSTEVGKVKKQKEKTRPTCNSDAKQAPAKRPQAVNKFQK